MKYIRWTLYLVVAAAALIIAAGNKQLVSLHFNPLDTSAASALTLPAMRLSFIIFATLAIGFVLGGIFMWFRHHNYRKTARAMRWEANEAQREVQKLKKQVSKVGSGTKMPALS